MFVRLMVVLALMLVVGGLTVFRSRRQTVTDEDLGLRVPSALLAEAAGASIGESSPADGAHRTWIVFTTPFCATCGPVERLLRERFREDAVVRAEVEEWAETAQALGVRRAPTVVRVDAEGAVELMLPGPDAIREHLAVASLV